MAQFTELSEDVILHIFSFIRFRLLRRTICRVCKMWHRIASDQATVRKASSHEFESIRFCDTINDCQLKNLVQTIIWARTEDIIVLDLAKISISWEYVDGVSRRSHWRKLRFLFFCGCLVFNILTRRWFWTVNCRFETPRNKSFFTASFPLHP